METENGSDNASTFNTPDYFGDDTSLDREQAVKFGDVSEHYE